MMPRMPTSLKSAGQGRADATHVKPGTAEADGT
jgi:hypothetical protein